MSQREDSWDFNQLFFDIGNFQKIDAKIREEGGKSLTWELGEIYLREE